MKDWRTTIAGVAGAIALIANEIANLLDGNPETIFNIEAIIAALSLIGIGVLAKDKNDPKDSEPVE